MANPPASQIYDEVSTGALLRSAPALRAPAGARAPSYARMAEAAEAEAPAPLTAAQEVRSLGRLV